MQQDMTEIDWTQLGIAAFGVLGTLGGVYVGAFLQRRQTHQDNRRNARYRLLVGLRKLQRMVGESVARVQAEHRNADNCEKELNDSVLRLALSSTTRELQDSILDILRENDGLHELRLIRRALSCPEPGAQRWLESLNEAIRDLEKVVCPRLRECEEELYRELPEGVRRIIEHPESIRGRPVSERQGGQ